MADIAERKGAVALAHPGNCGGDIERRPVRHRGLEADQRFRLVVAFHRLRPGIADAAVVIGQDRAAPPREIARKAAIDLARDGRARIDQDGMAPRASRQEERRPQRIPIGRWDCDVVGENVVRRSFAHRDSPFLLLASSKCESGFCRKGLPWRGELQLAVRRQAVYNAALHSPAVSSGFCYRS